MLVEAGRNAHPTDIENRPLGQNPDESANSHPASCCTAMGQRYSIHLDIDLES